MRYSFDLVLHLVAREYQLRYRRAVIGWLWSVTQPLVRFAVFAFVFTRVIHVGGIPNYATYLFIGLVAWTWFSSGVLSATTSVLTRRDLLLRPGVPRVTAPFVSVLTDMLDFLAAFPIVLAFVAATTGLSLHVVALPVLMLVELVLILGFGMMLCAANVYFRDVSYVVDVGLLLGFYLTPVFYQGSSIQGTASLVYRLNPVAVLLDGYRSILLDHRFPRMLPLLALATVSIVMFFIGWMTYQRASATFLDEL